MIDQDKSQFPPIPRISLKKIFATRRELYARLWKPFEADNEIVGDNYDGMVAEASKLFPAVRPAVIADSIAPLLGTRATDAVLWALAWRLAGNVLLLREGIPVRPWALQREQEWIPFQITAMKRDPRRRASGQIKAGCTFTCQSLAGTFCPGTVQHWWSKSQGNLVAGAFGFSAPWGKYPFRDAHQLVGLRFYGLFTPETCVGGKPGFDQVACPASFVEYNRDLLHVRCRVQPCPRGYSHPCHLCSVGYRNPDGCQYATHAAHYVSRACPACEQAEAAFDPDDSSTKCIDCTVRARYAQE